MLQTKLESLLESGFSELDGLFAKREYGETIRLGATVDDAGPFSVESIRKRFADAKTEQARYIASLSHYDMTDYQNAVLEGAVPFFRRTCFYRNFKIIYDAFVNPERDAYESVADELVPQVSREMIKISWKGERVVDLRLRTTVDVENYIKEECLERYPPDIRERVPILARLDSQQYVSEEVCDAVISFLR